MRTTIDLPEDLHQIARQKAHETGRTMSDVVAELMRRGLGAGAATPSFGMAHQGLPVVSVGHVVTTEDVGSLDDDS